MASKLNGADIGRIGVQTDVTSPVHDTNYQNLKNKVNELIDELAVAVIATTNAETTDSRPYHADLKERLDSMWDGQFNYVKSGGVVSISSSLEAEVTAGEAKINGIDTAWNANVSSPISLAVSTKRFDVVVANSAGTLTVVAGTESADAVFPTIANTQKPLALLTVTTSTITAEDARNWGAYYLHDGQFKWKWKAQDALDDLVAGTGGSIKLIGKFYEELNLSGISNINLLMNDASVYRISDTNTCLKSVNSGGNETTRTKIIGGRFYGNSKAGSLSLLKFDYADELTIRDCYFDGNASSSATSKNITITNSEKIHLINNNPIVDPFKIDQWADLTSATYSSRKLTNATLTDEWGEAISYTISYTGRKVNTISAVYYGMTFTMTLTHTGRKVTSTSMVIT